MKQLEARLIAYRPLIVDEMRAIVGDDPAGLYAWMRYHLGWEDGDGKDIEASPGKLLRPAALLLAAELHGGSTEQSVPAAAAVQLVHDFSLLHDDIEDASDLRRGRPALWTFAGTAQAINTGDGMYTLARLAMQRLRTRGLDERIVLDAMAELDEACLRLVEGQYLDISFEGREQVHRAEYLAMIEGKTAALLAAAFAIGGMLAAADAPAVAALRDFGRHVGLAFQAVDDLLGVWGDSDLTGKPVGDDLLARKMTYPIICALESGVAPKLADAYWRPDSTLDRAVVAGEIEQAGGRTETEELVAHEVEAAMQALDRLSLTAADRRLLDAFLRMATDREA